MVLHQRNSEKVFYLFIDGDNTIKWYISTKTFSWYRNTLLKENFKEIIILTITDSN